jgi:hypothetical protein
MAFGVCVCTSGGAGAAGRRTSVLFWLRRGGDADSMAGLFSAASLRLSAHSDPDEPGACGGVFVRFREGEQ